MELDVAQTPAAQPTLITNPTAAATTSDAVVDVRTGLQADALRQAVLDHLRYSIGRPGAVLTPEHFYRALALAVRDRMQQRWIATTQTYLDLSQR
jgi:glycogen phosphorylase